jgi:hypothetical protein
MCVFNLVLAMSARELPNDVEALKALVLAHVRSLAERDHELARSKQTIAALEHKLFVWGKMLFSPRSEKRPLAPEPSAGQTWLPFADLLADAQRLADQRGVHGSLELQVTTAAPSAP